jgi:hypothetical protein
LIPELRNDFNARFTPEKYRRFLDLLTERCGCPVEFRNAETPCFLPDDVLTKMERYGRELVAQVVTDAEYLAAAEATIPPAYRVRRTSEADARPLFVQADFGLDETGEPKLVEIQGFPSLYAYQPVLAETYREAFGLDAALKTHRSGLDAAGYRERLRAAIVGDHAPENVVLLEIEPDKQKTLPDFLLTAKLLGVAIVDLMDVRQRGKRLFYQRDGREIPIARIYNRVIVDELERKSLTPPFDLTGELEVEWAGHPDWYFLLSKFSLPYFRHPSVPDTHFLDRVTVLPDDLGNWVLKPLFSFAGLGVKVGPTRDDIAAVTDRSQYILQRRVNFVPTVETPHGPTKVEVRIMYLWSDSQPEPMTALLRMGRGKMMGVDHNREMEWVGASAAFTP